MTTSLVAGGWNGASAPACITAVAGATAADVLPAFSVEPYEPLAISDSEFDPTTTVLIAETPSGVALLEQMGYEGTRPEVLELISSSGPTASAFWSINGDTLVSLAESGRVLAQSEAVYPVEDDGPASSLLQSIVDSIDPDVPYGGDAVSGMLGVVRRFTGLDINHQMFENIALGYRVVPLASHRHRPPLDPTRLRYTLVDDIHGVGDRALAELLADASADDRQQFAQWAARTALEENDLGANGLLVAALASRDAGVQSAPAIGRLLRKLRAEHAQAASRRTADSLQAERFAWRRAAAVSTVDAYVTCADPERRVVYIVKSAIAAHAAGRDSWRHSARHWLQNH